MPEGIGAKLKAIDIKGLMSSNITRVALSLIVLSLYYAFISPSVENFFLEKVSKITRDTRVTTMNSLSPVFNIYTYAGNYNLSSQLSSDSTSSSSKFYTVDARVVALNKFLADYHSPMAPYAETFVTEADKYGLDWRLVASISGVESAFGNIVPNGDSNNAWGWRGINANANGWSVFVTWNDGIKEITRGLAEGYGTDLTPFEIEPSYCPPCAAGSAHAWANGVTNFMNELDYYVDNLDNL